MRSVLVKLHMDSGAVIGGIYKTDKYRTDEIMRELFPAEADKGHSIFGFGRPDAPNEGNIYVMMDHIVAVDIA